MGRRLYNKTVKHQQVLGILLTIIIIIGCPNLNKHVWFVKDGKLNKELQLRFEDGKILIKLGSASSLGSEKTDYFLQLLVEVRFSAELRDELEFNPKSICVLADGYKMERDTAYFGNYEDSKKAGKYMTGISFSYDMKIDSLIVASVYRREGFPLRICVDKFIQYKGEDLVIDTIYAVEKQPFLY